MPTKGLRRFMPRASTVVMMAAALALLAIAGYGTKPQWQPWWYAATICDGHLSASDLADVLPNKRLQAGKEEMGSESGHMKCGVNTDDRHSALAVDVYSKPDEVARELNLEFTIPHEPRYVFPKGIPGFYGEFGPLIIQECPAWGRDPEGRKQRIVTRVMGNWDKENVTPSSLRIATAMANAAAAKLHCGAAPLPRPKQAMPDGQKAVPLNGVSGTPCEWIAKAPLPRNKSGTPWKVAVQTDDQAPITACTLVDAKSGHPMARFNGWYGDWSDRPFETLVTANVEIPSGYHHGDALMSEHFGRATARCDGEPANYQASSYTADDEQHISGSELQPLLESFARDQSKRHGCTALKLPTKGVYPNTHL
ncbi:hypothetical protein [Streptomyces blastmyceticus]|uniref:DUF2599 domain-containing protein n=1 Tax=Streptomyces blastmyceticus TaxID=68180 RepID=A0ABP3HL34_9ACTN